VVRVLGRGSTGSESEKQNTEAEFAEGAILRPHKLEATSCEQHSFFKIDGLTPCNAQVHWLVNRLDGPTSRKELILISIQRIVGIELLVTMESE